jgi:DNA primase catalytic subunit
MLNISSGGDSNSYRQRNISELFIEIGNFSDNFTSHNGFKNQKLEDEREKIKNVIKQKKESHKAGSNKSLTNDNISENCTKNSNVVNYTNIEHSKDNQNNTNDNSSLFSVKTSDDLQLSIDLNNIKLNETMGTEEFLRMMDEI